MYKSQTVKPQPTPTLELLFVAFMETDTEEWSTLEAIDQLKTLPVTHVWFPFYPPNENTDEWSQILLFRAPEKCFETNISWAPS